MNAPATTDDSLDAKLFRLTAENQELVPDHTHKAFMLRVEALETVEAQCELLEEGMAEFRRGLPG
jgi:hypothetical protein